MDSIYTDGTYLKQNPLWHEDDSAWKAGHILRLIDKHGLRPRTICEVGCGAGEILKQLSTALPARCVGYEISPDAYARCSRKATPNLSFRFGSAFDDADIHDLVMAIDVFEHVEDYFGFLRRLRPRGRYKVFHIPLELSAQNVLRARPLMDARRGVGHIHHFNRDTALAALEDTGYEIIDHFYTSGRTELGSLGWKSQMLKWPRKMLYGMNPEAAVRLLGGYSLMVLAR